MIREQSVIKLPQTEIPLLAFDEPGFWVITVIVLCVVVLWITRRKR